MQLQELYHRLSVGFLSNLAIGMDGAGDLSAKGKTAAIVHVNAALRNLAKRFTLREDNLVLQLLIGQTRYHLKSAHAVSNMVEGSDPANFYIIDTDEEPFTDEVLKVLRVYGSNGHEFSLNEPDNPFSIHTPAPNQLQVPTDTGAAMLAVNYRTYLDEVPADALPTYEIPIPMVLEDPIVIYVASQIFGNMNGQEHIVRSQMLSQTYEQELDIIASEDLLDNSQINFQNKFNERGFV